MRTALSETIRACCGAPEVPVSDETLNAWADEAERLQDWLEKLVGIDNHLRGCDRDMGDSHPCTCGTREIYRVLNGLKP